MPTVCHGAQHEPSTTARLELDQYSAARSTTSTTPSPPTWEMGNAALVVATLKHGAAPLSLSRPLTAAKCRNVPAVPPHNFACRQSACQQPPPKYSVGSSSSRRSRRRGQAAVTGREWNRQAEQRRSMAPLCLSRTCTHLDIGHKPSTAGRVYCAALMRPAHAHLHMGLTQPAVSSEQ